MQAAIYTPFAELRPRPLNQLVFQQLHYFRLTKVIEKMIKIILAEDNLLVRDGIKMLLDLEGGIEVVGEASDGQEVVHLLESGREADLVLTDLNMPGMGGLELIQTLGKIRPQLPLVVLSMNHEKRYITEAFNAGAKGYLIKGLGSEELLFAISHVHMGNHYLCSEASMSLLQS